MIHSSIKVTEAEIKQQIEWGKVWAEKHPRGMDGDNKQRYIDQKRVWDLALKGVSLDTLNATFIGEDISNEDFEAISHIVCAIDFLDGGDPILTEGDLSW